MGKATTDDVLNKREQDMAKFVASFPLTPKQANNTPKNSSDNVGTQKQRASSGAPKKMGSETDAEPQKKSGREKPKGQGRADTFERPELQRALRKSRVQKTLRFPPMLIVEYEQMCDKLGVEPEFNQHMNEALADWLDRKQKQL